MKLSKLNLAKIDFSKNRILIDWFSFSSKIDSFQSMSRLIGMSDCNWECVYGVKGYDRRYKFYGITIHVASENQQIFQNDKTPENARIVEGAWLEMSGEGCRTFETYGNGDWQKLLDYIVENADDVVTNRIDLAYDDFLGFLDMEQIVEYTEKRSFVSKFRAPSQVIKSIGEEDVACTVTHGRLKSDIFIRIYDKRLEQEAQEFCDHWVRAEIMLRHQRAFAAISLLCDEHEYHGATMKLVRERISMDEVYFMVMNNYLRYIDASETDSNKWRAPVAKHWQKFSESVTTYRVSLWEKPGTEYTTSRLDNYVENMSAAAIYTYINIHGVDKLLKVCDKKRASLAPKYKLLISDSLVENSDEDENSNDYLVELAMERYKPSAEFEDLKQSFESFSKRKYVCLCCGEIFYYNDMVLCNYKSMTGQCRNCTQLNEGAVMI